MCIAGRESRWGVSDAFVVNKAAEHPEVTVWALEEILENFAVKLYERGAGIPVWDTGNACKPEDDVCRQIENMAGSADKRMQYWVNFIWTDAESEVFMRGSEELGSGNIYPGTVCQGTV